MIFIVIFFVYGPFWTLLVLETKFIIWNIKKKIIEFFDSWLHENGKIEEELN